MFRNVLTPLVRASARRAPVRLFARLSHPPPSPTVRPLPVWALAFAGGFLASMFALSQNAVVAEEDKIARIQRSVQQRVQSEMQQDQEDSNASPIYRIVLTGGPCGGKSTAVATISERLLSLGFRVLRVPEAATLVITGTGANFNKMDVDERRMFEASIVRTKIALEDIFYRIARASRSPSVILCDRGTMDSIAYMSPEEWEIMLDDNGWNTVELRDKRYDAIIHMVTAAIGAETYYTTENNAARSESLNQARDLDYVVLNGWNGHPHLYIVRNTSFKDFKSKVRRVEDLICQIVGVPRPISAERKFIVSQSLDVSSEEISGRLGITFEKFSVEQTYLVKSERHGSGYNYVRRRGQNGVYTYTHSMVRSDMADDSDERMPHGEQVILERSISGREYIALLKSADPNRLTVKKRIMCFVFDGVVYELQTFSCPDIGLSILKTDTDRSFDEISPPWFIQVKGEITGIPEFSSYFLSEHYHNVDARLPLNWKSNQVLTQAYQNARKRDE